VGKVNGEVNMPFKKGEKRDTSNDKPRKEQRFLLATLDDETRLYASSNSFSLCKLKNNDWVSDGYYTSIVSAIQGYAKHELRNSKRMKTGGDLERLIKIVTQLDNSVKELGKNLEAKFRKDIPMFDSLCSSPEEDTSEEDENISPF
jgi:hypothetical protein